MSNEFQISRFIAPLFLSLAAHSAAIAASPAGSAEKTAGSISLLRFIQKWEGTSAKRGEFEASSDYESRLASDGFTGQRFIVYVPFQANKGQQSAKSYAYDADKKELTVWFSGHSSISNSSISDFVVSYKEPIPASYPKYYLSYQEKVVDRYSAMNGFGARTTVTSMRRDDVSFALANYPLGQTERPNFQRSISILPDAAKQLTESGYWRFTLESTLIPSQRRYIAEDFQQFDATIQYPTKLVISSKVLMVKVISAELVNSTTNEVALSIEPEPSGKTSPKIEDCSSPYSLITNTKLCK